MAESELIELCKKEDVSEGEPLKVETNGLELAVFRVGDSFFVTDDACTHGPGSLSEGFQEGHVIECDFHAGQFDVRDGSIVAPPCVVALRTHPVVDHDTDVVIKAPDA